MFRPASDDSVWRYVDGASARLRLGLPPILLDGLCEPTGADPAGFADEASITRTRFSTWGPSADEGDSTCVDRRRARSESGRTRDSRAVRVGRRFTRPISLIAAASGATAVAPAAYLAILTAAAIRCGDGKRSSGPSAEGDEAVFVVCVPAHDEEATIRATVSSLLAQNYPAGRFEVHVVADNCSDSTAEIAAAAGASVHVRTAPADPGKGPALNWLHDRLIDGVDGECELDFDVVVVVDADTLAEPDFLSALDGAFASGTVVAQGYYGVRDPGASSAVALRYAALACRHHLRPLGRHGLGGSCGLFGNGMAFRRDVLADRRWTGHLVEDAEMQMELFAEGIQVDYVPTARIAAEMPEGLEQAASQNERWELGRAQLLSRYASPLARSALAGGPLGRRAYADALADLVLPRCRSSLRGI